MKRKVLREPFLAVVIMSPWALGPLAKQWDFLQSLVSHHSVTAAAARCCCCCCCCCCMQQLRCGEASCSCSCPCSPFVAPKSNSDTHAYANTSLNDIIWHSPSCSVVLGLVRMREKARVGHWILAVRPVPRQPVRFRACLDFALLVVILLEISQPEPHQAMSRGCSTAPARCTKTTASALMVLCCP